MIRTSMGAAAALAAGGVACVTLSTTGTFAVVLAVAVMSGQGAHAQPGAVAAVSDDDGGASRGADSFPALDGVCPWDCGDGDGTVGLVDFLGLLAGWGQPGPCDFDGGGVVGITDFLALLANWGPCP